MFCICGMYFLAGLPHYLRGESKLRKAKSFVLVSYKPEVYLAFQRTVSHTENSTQSSRFSPTLLFQYETHQN